MLAEPLPSGVLFVGLIPLSDGSVEHVRLNSATRGRTSFIEVEGLGEFSPKGELRRCYLSQPDMELMDAVRKVIEEL